jgi:hypothetical protein
MRYRVRALAVAGTVSLLAAGSLAATAAPSGAQEVTASDCGSTTYRWLFWPEGHGALASVPHAATDSPHLDVYAGKGKKFLDTQNVAYADGVSATTNAACTPAPLPASGSGSIKSHFGKAKQLVCKSTANPIFVAVPESTVELPSLSMLGGDKLVASAQMGTSADVASTLDYDGKTCKLKKPPK